MEKGVFMTAVEEALEKETLAQIEKLSTMDDGSEEKRRATEQVKNMVDSQVSVSNQKIEKRHKLGETVLKAVSVVGGLVLAGVTTAMTFRFEETGSITGFASRKSLQDNMNPKF
jgi:hypothetical protein